MKILETQSATLTNYEVLTHLESTRAKNDQTAQEHSEDAAPTTMESRNLETVVKELTDYLHTPKNPLAPPSKYNESTIQTLMQALQPYDLTKAELLMIINLRPDNAGVLDCIVEELDQRFSEEVQEEMLRVVVDVLGAREEDGEDGEDGEGEKGGFSEGL